MNIGRFTRRPSAVLATCAAAAVLALASCGDDSDDGGSASGAEQREMRHARGTTLVPADPQRIVVVDREGTSVGYLARLGIYPIAATTDEDPNTDDRPFDSLGPEAAEIEVRDGALVPPLSRARGRRTSRPGYRRHPP